MTPSQTNVNIQSSLLRQKTATPTRPIDAVNQGT